MSGIRRRALRFVAPPLALLLAASPAAAQGRCATPEELTAFEVRALRTEMMVAWLSCRALPGRDFLPHLNGFLQRHRATLQRHDTAFTGHFTRLYGGQGKTALDRYMTSLANEYSRVSMGAISFCDDQAVLFERAAAVEARELERFAAERAGIQTVFVPPSRCAAPASPAPAPATRAAQRPAAKPAVQ